MILVTGATGLVGSHLLYSLLTDHERVAALYRDGSDRESIREVFSFYTSEPDAYYRRIQWRKADLIDIPALSDAFEGITHVYHCAALINFDPKVYAQLKKTNVEGTANVVNLCLSNNIQKLCYVSSVATLGTAPEGTATTEETHWNSEQHNSVYAITKYGAEMEVWRGSQEGLSIVIVNPGVIVGEGQWDSASAAVIKTGLRGIPVYTSGTIGLVDVRDVVRAMIALMKSSISQERFILVGSNTPYKDLLSSLATLAGKKPPDKYVARWKMKLISALEGVFSFLFRRQRKLSAATVRSMYTVTKYDSTKVEKQLNFHFTPLEETLERVVTHYQASSEDTD